MQKPPKPRLTREQAIYVRELFAFGTRPDLTYASVARELGVSWRAVSRAVRRTRVTKEPPDG